MPRITITLPKTAYNRVTSIAMQNDDSMSGIINKLIVIGMNNLDQSYQPTNDTSNRVQQHCYQLIIQMNALIKNLSAEILKFDQNDFEQLRKACEGKYNELVVV
jgi:hypothetical protein